MGLKLYISEAKEYKCPKCGDTVYVELVRTIRKQGHEFSPVLEAIGYGEEEYGEEMVLDTEQVVDLMAATATDYKLCEIETFVAMVNAAGNKISVCADW